MSIDLVKATISDRFLSARAGCNLWARNRRNPFAWRDGRIFQVMPATVEFAPTLSCNQACHECSYKQQWLAAGCLKRIELGGYAEPDGRTTADEATAQLIMERSAEAGVEAMLWTGGGDPAVWAPLPQAIEYAASRGLVNGLYSNGMQFGMHPGLAEQLMAPDKNLHFIRLSINAVDFQVAKRFSGNTPEQVEAQLRGLRHLLEARNRSVAARADRIWTPPAVMVSVIVDKINVGDLSNVCQTVLDLYQQHGSTPTGNDRVVVRPLTLHGRKSYSGNDHDETVIRQIIAVCGAAGAAQQRFAELGIGLHLGFGLDRLERGEVSSYSEIIAREYDERSLCYANGLFLTAGPDGTAYLCCDRNCDPEWAIGSLKETSVEALYASKKRKAVLGKVHIYRCGPNVCEPTCRAVRLNRIARCLRRLKPSDAELDQLSKKADEDQGILLN